jgi:hydroxyacylglutathione hydrolase
LERGTHINSPRAGYVNRRIACLLWVKARFDTGWTHSFPPFRPRAQDLLIRGDTGLREIGLDLDGTILETPGHTKDSLSIVLGDGRCFVGDAAAAFPEFAGTRHCAISLNDWDQYYQSWDKLLSCGASHIFPAHGKPFPATKLVKDLKKNKKTNMVLWSA